MNSTADLEEQGKDPIRFGPLRLLHRDAQGICHFEEPAEYYDFSAWPDECGDADACYVGGVPFLRDAEPEEMSDRLRHALARFVAHHPELARFVEERHPDLRIASGTDPDDPCWWDPLVVSYWRLMDARRELFAACHSLSDLLKRLP